MPLEDELQVINMKKEPLMEDPNLLVFLIILVGFTIVVSLLSQAFGFGLISTSFLKTLGKAL